MEQNFRVAIGIEDYREMIDKNYYYIDKTLLIKDLLDDGGKVNLFTRPRRFGKTLALSMIKTFFECSSGLTGEKPDNRFYFENMKIIKTGEAYMRHMGAYPVISLSLKSAKQKTYEMAYESLLDEIRKEYIRHRYVLCGNALIEVQKRQYEAVMNRCAEPITYAKGLAFLSECLKQYHDKKVMILLDEYDVPLENAYFNGYYDEMAAFIRSLFESALKTNDCLEMAVITGCLRISRESIFTGLNNLKIHSVIGREYAEYFGFTEWEVQEMLRYFGADERMDDVRKWYDGYRFGETAVYNPWSVTNFVKELGTDIHAFPRAYWSNTSSNSIVKDLIEHADHKVKNELEELIAGGRIEKPLYEDVTYDDMYQTQDNLWNFLLFTGYLKAVDQSLQGGMIYLELMIPNEEIRYIYRNFIRDWFDRELKRTDFSSFYQNILEGREEEMAAFITKQLSVSISYYDNAENFYHGYMVGILSGMEGYQLDSNKEHGNGRPDILLSPYDPKGVAVILELKRAEKFSGMETLCEEALEQIEKREYASELLKEGYLRIRKYGICFCRKSCLVKTAYYEMPKTP